MTEDTKLGYAMLRLLSHSFFMGVTCAKFRGDYYLSSALFKQGHLSKHTPIVHGPCVSDIGSGTDYAFLETFGPNAHYDGL